MSERHYLDFASSAPLRPEAAHAMRAFMEGATFGDPGRNHHDGLYVRELVEHARAQVAAFLHVRASEVVFTASGTEAANTASLLARRAGKEAPIVLANVEHAAVRMSSERNGPIAALPVDHVGRVDVDALDVLLTNEPSLVHCQFANHEVGTRQPVEHVIATCHERNVPVHVDACAAAGQMPIDFGSLGADLVSVSAHKFGGPTGIGALVVKRGTRLSPLLVGGTQERARRAGMENVLGIVGFGAVAEALSAPGALEVAAIAARGATERLLTAATAVDGVVAYGDTVERVPHLCCVGIQGVEAEGIVLGLDQAGIAVHSGSACSSEALEPSPVLEAMGVDAERSLRASVGWSTTPADITAFEDCFSSVVSSLRALGA